MASEIVTLLSQFGRMEASIFGYEWLHSEGQINCEKANLHILMVSHDVGGLIRLSELTYSLFQM